MRRYDGTPSSIQALSNNYYEGTPNSSQELSNDSGMTKTAVMREATAEMPDQDERPKYHSSQRQLKTRIER